MRLLKALPGLILMCGVLFGCKKQSDTFPSFSLSAYYPLQTGKYFLYRLDSTLYVSFGSVSKVVSYLAKDSIVGTFTDNSGRTAYTVFRYTTDTLLSAPWQYKFSYYITPTANSVEVVDDNNYRFIKLTEPVMEAHSWPGNSYLETKNDIAISYLNNWNYTYQNVNTPYSVLAGTIDSTLTVLQQDDTYPEGPFDPNNYQQRNYSVEVYAKGIGLIYKEFLHWTWQTDPPPAHYDDGSYGVKLSLISYN